VRFASVSDEPRSAEHEANPKPTGAQVADMWPPAPTLAAHNLTTLKLILEDTGRA